MGGEGRGRRVVGGTDRSPLVYIYIYIYILVASHEEAMQTEHIRLHKAHCVEKLFDLLSFSMSHSKGVDRVK